MQVLKTQRRLIVKNSKFVEIHKWFKSKDEWERFLEDPRILVPLEIRGKAIVLILALPQLALEKKVAYITSGRLYIPRELLKKISKDGWVAELVIKIIMR